MKKLPIGMQSFKEIITGDYVYVDKTQYIYNLINGAKHYFLSRPRRFGKSLLLDTIGEAFGGDKELFKGLWIYGSDYGFEKHPVIRLDMSGIANKSPDVLENSILSYLDICYSREGLMIKDGIAADAFRRLIILLYEKYGKRVAVLVDEYDKPILDHITDIGTADANRQVMRGFYGILKSLDQYLRFTFITGVSKFAKTSLFSELNNLLDITLAKKFANICGIAIEDLGKYFGSHIQYLSTLEDFKRYNNNLQDEILAWYDGYSWDGKTRALNPFSLLNFFGQERFGAFWYTSGTPRFLLELIKKRPESYTSLKNLEITECMLDSVEIGNMAIEPLLFQTGYLTIKDVEMAQDEFVYVMDVPNNEVRRAFNMHVLAALAESDDVRAGQVRMAVNKALLAGDLQKMLEIMRGFFASIPFNLHVDAEAYYHSVFYAFMTALGFDMDVEVSASKGKVDAILDLDDKVYVMEFKYKKCPPGASDEEKRELFGRALDEALSQIKARGYGAKYQGRGKTVYQAAFAFLGRDSIEMAIG